MINAIINGVINLIISLVNIVLAPIDLLIENALPGLDYAFNLISGFFNYIGGFVGYAVSWLGLNNDVLSLIVVYYTFKLTVPYAISTIKLAVKWYNNLKL